MTVERGPEAGEEPSRTGGRDALARPQTVGIGAAVVCAVKRGLRRCNNPAVGVCQYCGRPFCAHHCEAQDGEDEICSRRFCVEKRRDLARHLAYRALVTERNRLGLCGLERCRSARLEGICTRCRGLFCVRHIDARQEMVVQNGVRLPRTATLCRHCWARRPIWTRV